MEESIKKRVPFNQALAYSLSLYQEKKYDKAEKTLLQLLEQAPDNPYVCNLLGNVYWAKDSALTAIEYYEKAVKSNPQFAEAYHNLGNALKDTGEFGKAETALRKALEINPLLVQTYRTITDCKKYTSVEDDDIVNIKKVIDDRRIIPTDKIHLYFALGKIYGDCKSYDEAFNYFRLANNLRFSPTKANVTPVKDFVNRCIHYLTQDYFNKNKTSGNESSVPLFIVGMPRSGTTLIEQILAAHSKIETIGESGAIEFLAQEMFREHKNPVDYFDVLKNADEDSLKDKAGKYLSGIRSKFPSTEVQYVVDKMPANFIYLGFIARLFPNAKIIHCVRDRMDTCLSNYFTYFANGNEYSYNLTALGKYYIEYERLMKHWKEHLPIKILDVQYETLVGNQEAEVKRMLEFLDLDFEEQCISFYEQRGNVKTASVWQVRQPITTASVNKWKHYEKHLKPLMDVFDARES